MLSKRRSFTLNSCVQISIEVEAVWALITPKNVTNKSKVKNIAVASVYYTKATKRSDFIDHVSEHLLYYLQSMALIYILLSVVTSTD